MKYGNKNYLKIYVFIYSNKGGIKDGFFWFRVNFGKVVIVWE